MPAKNATKVFDVFEKVENPPLFKHNAEQLSTYDGRFDSPRGLNIHKQ